MATAINSAAPSTPPVTPHAPDAPSSAYLSDEEILGIIDEAASAPASARDNSAQAADDFSWDSPAPQSDAHSSFGRVRAPANGRVAQGGVKPWGSSQPNSEAPPNTPRSPANHAQSITDPLSTNASSNGTENPDVFNSTSATEPISAPLPEWLAQISAVAPSAAPELANLWERATALDTFDRAFYGADASAQQQLITQLYSDDPAAFRAMVITAAQLLDASARPNDFVARPRFVGAGPLNSQISPTAIPQNSHDAGFVARPRFVGAGPFDATNTHPSGTSPSAHDQSSSGNHLADRAPSARGTTNIADGIENPRPYEAGRATNSNPAQNFNPVAYAQFEQSTNDAVVSEVSRAIDRAITRALPDGIADGARRRIASDTLAEVHTTLRGDRQLASQVAAMLRSGDASGTRSPRFDAATRDAIARLISTRARGVVPEAARRVISEWTGSVLSAHRERTARQQSAGARVDVVGSERQSPQPRRAVKSTDINYRATSDDDILSW